MKKIKKIGIATNYYGGVCIKEKNNKYYWGIESYDGITNDNWEEIPKYLYNALIRFEKLRMKKKLLIQKSPNKIRQSSKSNLTEIK